MDVLLQYGSGASANKVNAWKVVAKEDIAAGGMCVVVAAQNADKFTATEPDSRRCPSAIKYPIIGSTGAQELWLQPTVKLATKGMQVPAFWLAYEARVTCRTCKLQNRVGRPSQLLHGEC